jgi:hypothetical protein
MKHFLFVSFILVTNYYRAQLLDSLHAILKHKYSIDARLESRNSFVNNKLISVSGVRLGVFFQRKLKIGFGISWLKTSGNGVLRTDIKKDFYVSNSFGKIDTVNKYLKLAYACVYMDLVFYKIKQWQLSIPLQFGFGNVWFEEGKKYSLKKTDKKYLMFLYEPGITVQYKITRWAGLGADVAYRFAFQNSKKTGERLSSPSLTFKALFWFDQLYYELFPKSAVTKKYGPAAW